MKILLCAATPMEMFHSAFPGSEVDRVITGIGIAHTAFTLGAFLANTSVDLCLQIGIAGTFNPDLEIGSVVAVQKDCFADLGVEDHDRFVHITEALALDTQNAFDRLWIQPEDQLISQLDLPIVTAITVNTTHGNRQSIDKVISKYPAEIESMEGAPFFAACMTAGIPCLQIRAISNLVEPRNKSNWNIPLAIHRLHQEVERILPKLHLD